MQSITRKFLTKNIPNLKGKRNIAYNRFYLYRRNGIVIRVQSKGEKFELERKVDKSKLIRDGDKILITKDEFNSLCGFASDNIIRDSYLITNTPQTVLRIYHGKYEGLVRAEIEFHTVGEAERFIPFDWLGQEITDTPLAKDGTLLDLTDDDFQHLLTEYSPDPKKI